MDKIELLIVIGNEICEDCGEYRGCCLEYEECIRIATAIDLLDKYIQCKELKCQKN